MRYARMIRPPDASARAIGRPLALLRQSLYGIFSYEF